MKVLILSTGTGEGHNSAAKAVKEQFEKRGIPCELADVLNFASDKAGAYGRRIYIWSTVRAKKVFAGAYRVGRAISSARLKSPVYFANALYADKLCSYITENGYDTVVMPHLFPAEAMTWLLRQHKLDVQTYFIATDYTCIPFTEETKVDYYFIHQTRHPCGEAGSHGNSGIGEVPEASGKKRSARAAGDSGR